MLFKACITNFELSDIW